MLRSTVVTGGTYNADWMRNSIHSSKTVADQMVIKVKQPFIQTYDRVEVFVNNDGLREYRIPLILENQSNNLLPQQMTEIVRWFNETAKKIWVF